MKQLSIIIAAAAILCLPATAQGIPITVHEKVIGIEKAIDAEVVRGDPIVGTDYWLGTRIKETVVHRPPADVDDDGIADDSDDCIGVCAPPEPVYAESTESSYSEPSYAPSGDLSSIAACESGSDYSANTGNGYTGAYQFDDATWQAAGGSTASAYQASPAEQDAVAASWIAAGNRSAWPNC